MSVTGFFLSLRTRSRGCFRAVTAHNPVKKPYFNSFKCFTDELDDPQFTKDDTLTVVTYILSWQQR